jgi:hypothetical protein
VLDPGSTSGEPLRSGLPVRPWPKNLSKRSVAGVISKGSSCSLFGQTRQCRLERQRLPRLLCGASVAIRSIGGYAINGRGDAPRTSRVLMTVELASEDREAARPVFDVPTCAGPASVLVDELDPTTRSRAV